MTLAPIPLNAAMQDAELDSRRYRYLVSDPEGARHLLLLLQQGKGDAAAFHKMVDRLIASKANYCCSMAKINASNKSRELAESVERLRQQKAVSDAGIPGSAGSETAGGRTVSKSIEQHAMELEIEVPRLREVNAELLAAATELDACIFEFRTTGAPNYDRMISASDAARAAIAKAKL